MFIPIHNATIQQTIDEIEVRRLKEQKKLGATEIAKQMGIARTSVYRVLKGD